MTSGVHRLPLSELNILYGYPADFDPYGTNPTFTFHLELDPEDIGRGNAVPAHPCECTRDPALHDRYLDITERLPDLNYVRSLSQRYQLWPGLFEDSGKQKPDPNAVNAYLEHLSQATRALYVWMRIFLSPDLRNKSLCRCRWIEVGRVIDAIAYELEDILAEIGPLVEGNPFLEQASKNFVPILEGLASSAELEKIQEMATLVEETVGYWNETEGIHKTRFYRMN